MPKPPERLQELAAQIKKFSETLASEDASHLTPLGARRVRQTINEAYETIKKVMDDLDPVKTPGFVFDPSNPNIVGRLVGITMVAQPRKRLENIEPFYGSGVYAIYYNGDFQPYKTLSRKEHPIYVGKADPEDPAAKTAHDQGSRLANRLNDHYRSICKAESTLRIEDFEYRALVVQSGWQGSAENYLIHLFRPIWNSEVGVCYGFGKHGDAPATRANLRSPWDTLHPGRGWAHSDPKIKDARPARKILDGIADHLSNHRPFASLDRILRTFLDEIREAS